MIATAPISTKNSQFKGTGNNPYLNFFDEINLSENSWNLVKEAANNEFSRGTKSSYLKFNNPQFEDYIFQSTEITKEMKLDVPKNLILYGPPGTGKTYNTIDLSVKITDQVFWEEHKDNREKLKLRFEELSSEGKINFTTFHQSMSYEDFIEGIKPVTDDDKNVTYEIEDGIFKSICENKLFHLFRISLEDNGPNRFHQNWTVS